jgi:abortive infection bacteriophage resistance protein
MGQISYDKPYLPVADQVRLLQARGMLISDSDRAEICLRRIGYYRLSGYWYPFRHREILTDSQGRQYDRMFENFRPGTEFAHVVNLYVFDKRLRLLFLDAIERIEVGLRVDIALLLGLRGAFAHRDISQFNKHFSTIDPDTGETLHAKFLGKLDGSYRRSREEFVDHFREKYISELPIWMSIELWDFGTLATILSGMKSADLGQLAAKYSLPKNNVLVSWAQSINFIRNICAHHGRLWNRPPVQQPSPVRDVELLQHLRADTHAQRRLYAVAATLQYLLRLIHPGSTWAFRLKEQIRTFPQTSGISIRQMGFPEEWDNLPLWN